MNKHKTPRVLIIAGSDSSGGAGIQADIKTLTVFKVFSMTAITAITAQNTNGVSSVESVSLDLIKKQIEDCISDIGVDAIKIGMVNKGEIFDLIFEAIKKYEILKKGIPIILDPVMFAKGGFPLLENQAISALKGSPWAKRTRAIQRRASGIIGALLHTASTSLRALGSRALEMLLLSAS